MPLSGAGFAFPQHLAVHGSNGAKVGRAIYDTVVASTPRLDDEELDYRSVPIPQVAADRLKARRNLLDARLHCSDPISDSWPSGTFHSALRRRIKAW